MADSDEEYDRRKTSREKFRRERNDYERRDDRRREGGWEHERSYSGGGRNREAWNNRNRERSNSYREYDNRRRDRYQNSPPRHELSPPQKRMRRDWDDNYPQYDMPYGGGGHMHGGGQPPHGNWGPMPDSGGGPPPQYGSSAGQRGPEPDYPTQPSMVTFKQFLSQQDDSIGDEDAVKKYNEYKLDFKRQQINEFFLAHKDEEWFKTKYHPEDRQKRQEEVFSAQKRRLEVFLELLNMGRLNSLSLDADKYDDIVKILDAAVILMEGGTEFDLQVLDQPEEPEEPIRSRNNSECIPQSDEGLVSSPEDKEKKTIKEIKPSSPDESKPPDQPLQLTITAEQEELKRKAEEFSKQQQEKTSDDDDDSTKGKKKRHRDKEYSYESGSESDSGSDSEPEPAPPGLENEPPPPGTDGKENENGTITKDGEPKEGKSDKEEKDVDTKEEEVDLGPPKPKPLHKTTSIFLRNLAPSITKQEVEAMCKRYPGFLRAALQDPQPERRFFRRGWVTFDKTVNIKEICWNLNNIRLRDCELGATINRELAKRVRPVGTFTHHKQVVKNDIKLAAKIVQNYDKKWKLWEDVNEEKKDVEKEPSFCLFSVSKNPLLKNITDYLVDEGNFEEEELLGQSVDDATKEGSDVSIERDETLLKVLDRLILYLRIVHSIDYYSANEYPNEDEMPHRCGIIHARGSPLGSGKTNNNDVTDWISLFENKVKHFTELHDQLNEDEASRLGKKDPEAEVEKFVTANTQELAQDRWLCPLSGKKFKGPEFVRKHIFSKHNEKVEEVKKEVAFFNNYLLDPKRPQLPDHPGNRPQTGGQNGGSGYNNPNYQGQGMGYNQSRGPMYGNGMQGSYQSSPYGGRDNRDSGYGRSNYNRRPYSSRPYNRYRTQSNDDFRSRRGNFRRSDPRGIIEYRDLDAPADMDIF